MKNRDFLIRVLRSCRTKSQVLTWMEWVSRIYGIWDRMELMNEANEYWKYLDRRKDFL